MRNLFHFAGTALISLFAVQAFSQAITVVSPSGGQTYDAEDSVVITWQADNAITQFTVEYALTGTRWAPVMTYTSAKRCVWFIPYLKATCTGVRIRVTAANISNPPSGLSGEFTINASSSVDPNEPNDSMSSARVTAIGSLVSGCIVYGVQDTLADPQKKLQDIDWFRFTLNSASLLTIKLVPEFSAQAGAFNRVNTIPYFSLYDAAQNFIVGNNTSTSSIAYRTASGGNFYCRVESAGPYCFYGIRIDTASGSGGITITAPNGGETFEGDAPVAIAWTGDPLIGRYRVEYSLSNGSAWAPITTTSATNCTWYTPYLATSSTTARIRVSAEGSVSVSDISNSAFTINKALFTDPYEPNGTAGIATAITLDSLFSGAVTFGGYTDTSSDSVTTKFIDEDFYKFTLPAAGLVTIRTIPEYGTATQSFNRSNTPPNFVLSDSANRWITMSSNNSLSYNATYAGRYLLRVYSGAEPWCKYGLRVSRGASAASMVITAPIDAQRYNADQPITLTWSADTSLKSFNIQYRFSGRSLWTSIATAAGRSYTWNAPFLKSDARIYLRVVAANIAGSLSDTTDSALTVAASAEVDPYEPNDDTAAARTITPDTVLSGCIVYGFPDTIADPQKVFTDCDIFRMNLKAGTLVTIATIPEFLKSDNGYNRSNTIPYLTLTDATGNRLAGSTSGTINYYSTSDATFYCTVAASDLWHKYKMSVSSVVLLAKETSTFASSAAQKQPDSSYEVRIAADTTDMVINVNLKEQIGGSVSTAVVDPKSLPVVNNSSGNFKTVSVVVDQAIRSSLNSADITLQYDQTDFPSTASEKTIAAKWFNDSVGEWQPVEFTVDTVLNVVSIQTTHFSLFGLFAAPPVAAEFIPETVSRPFALRTAVSNGGLIVHLFGIAGTVQPCVIRLYTITGKLAVERLVSAAGNDSRSIISLDCTNLAGGSYIVSVTQGANRARSLVSIIK